jgi:serine/threonine protein kinase
MILIRELLKPLTLKYFISKSMSDLLKRRKRLSEPETRYYLTQLISSLKYLHENLVIHRDLKLGNLFIDSQMRIKVGDFGLATKVTDVNERKKTICGTPNYIGNFLNFVVFF